jgi:hypothetical protein
MYKIIDSIYGQCVKKIDDSALIPMDEGNTDYKQYLEWVAEGNVAEVEEVNN